jgi:hypothetical protein
MRKIVSNQETVLRTENEGHTSATALRLVLIIVVQRPRKGNEVGKKGEDKWL